MGVDPVRQRTIEARRFGQPVYRELDEIREGCVRERVGRRVRHRARDVADRVVDDVVTHVDGIGVGRLADALHAAALVDGHVDEDRPGPHGLDHVVGDEGRRVPTGNEYRADEQVGIGDRPFDCALVGRERQDPALVDLVDPAQPVDVLVEQHDLGFHARGDPRRVPSDVPGAEHHHPSRSHPRCAPEQDAPTAARLLQVMGARLGGHAAGDLAHRGEERQRAIRGLHGLVGNCGAARSQAVPSPPRGTRRDGGT